MKKFSYQIKLNITNGFGNIVLNTIRDANVPAIMEQKLNNNGKIVSIKEKWDTGIKSHDLYLTYIIAINTYRVIKQNTNKWIAKLLKYSFLENWVLGSTIRSQIEENFKEQIKGNSLIVALVHCIEL